jgi:hypothetical protein
MMNEIDQIGEEREKTGTIDQLVEFIKENTCPEEQSPLFSLLEELAQTWNESKSPARLEENQLLKIRSGGLSKKFNDLIMNLSPSCDILTWRDSDEKGLLYLAVAHLNLEAVICLLQHNTNLATDDKQGILALSLNNLEVEDDTAASSRYLVILELLVNTYTERNITPTTQLNSLLSSMIYHTKRARGARYGDLENGDLENADIGGFIEILLMHNATHADDTKETRDWEWVTAIKCFRRPNDHAWLKALLTSTGARIGQLMFGNGQTLLHLAVLNDDSNWTEMDFLALKYILNFIKENNYNIDFNLCGKEIPLGNEYDSEDEGNEICCMPVLHTAVKKDNAAAVRMLLKAGAPPVVDQQSQQLPSELVDRENDRLYTLLVTAEHSYPKDTQITSLQGQLSTLTDLAENQASEISQLREQQTTMLQLLQKLAPTLDANSQRERATSLSPTVFGRTQY